jgi:putative FmdB family regulatory protein
MPIYEYTCRDCGHDFELFVRSAAALGNCPNCQSARIEKHFSTFASTQRTLGGSVAANPAPNCAGPV